MTVPMPFRAFLRLGCLVMAGLVLSGCIDYREELWIESDGSGKIHATIGVNALLAAQSASGKAGFEDLEKQLQELFAATEGAKVEKFQSYVDGSKKVWDFTVAFRDVRKLKPAIAAGPAAVGGFFGDFTIDKNAAGNLAVTRTVRMEDEAGAEGTPKGDDLEKALGTLLSGTLFTGYQFEYVTHFPTEVIGANTRDIDRETNTVTWRIPLTELSQGPVTMSAEIERPGRWWRWVFAALIAVVTAAIVIPALRRKQAGAPGADDLLP